MPTRGQIKQSCLGGRLMIETLEKKNQLFHKVDSAHSTVHAIDGYLPVVASSSTQALTTIVILVFSLGSRVSLRRGIFAA